MEAEKQGADSYTCGSNAHQSNGRLSIGDNKEEGVGCRVLDMPSVNNEFCSQG